MDIKKLHGDAMSIAKDVTKNWLVAAGGGEETMFSLVMKRVMEMVTKARKQSALKIASALREAHGRNRFLELTKKWIPRKDRWISRDPGEAERLSSVETNEGHGAHYRSGAKKD